MNIEDRAQKQIVYLTNDEPLGLDARLAMVDELCEAGYSALLFIIKETPPQFTQIPDLIIIHGGAVNRGRLSPLVLTLREQVGPKTKFMLESCSTADLDPTSFDDCFEMGMVPQHFIRHIDELFSQPTPSLSV